MGEEGAGFWISTLVPGSMVWSLVSRVVVEVHMVSGLVLEGGAYGTD